MCVDVDYVYYFSVNIKAEKYSERAHRCNGKSEPNLRQVVELWTLSKWI